MARKKVHGIPIKPPNVAHMKPAKFANYLTLGELAMEVNKDRDWIRKLERAGRIPAGTRCQYGLQKIRLYSPAMVKEIKEIFSTHKPGRPRKEGR